MNAQDVIDLLAGALSNPQPRASFIDQWSADFPEEFRQYNTTYPGAKEVIGWQLYDTQTYTSGTTTELPQWFNTRATPDLSNMQIPYQLPAPQAFLIRAVRFFVKQRPRVVTPLAAGGAMTGAVDNIAQLINTGVFTFTIGSKPYIGTPIWTLTAGGGASGMMALSAGPASTGTSIDYAQNGIADPAAVQSLTKPLFIQPQMNFTAVARWPAALTLAGGNTDISFMLDGDLVRAIQ